MAAAIARSLAQDGQAAQADVVAGSVDEVLRLEEELKAEQSIGERLGNVIGSFVATLYFVAVQLGMMVVWGVINLDLVPGIAAFDPYPFPLAGVLMSLEGVLLAAFVLLKQRHEARLSGRRSHLNLQATLMVERETTKLLQLLHRSSAEEHGHDAEAHALSHPTDVVHLSDALAQRIDRPRRGG